MSPRPEPRYIGLMSGTSIDAIDAVLVTFDGHRPRLIATRSQPIEASLRDWIIDIARGRNDDLASCAQLDRRLGQAFAETAQAVLDEARLGADDIVAIGSHGQTVRHRPDADPPFSCQLADPATIAVATGIDVVADFRRHDIAAGGQGAPLVPPFHAALWRDGACDRIVLNLGGMSNLSCLPADPSRPVTGFDCGPGNVLLDGWIDHCLGEAMDREGRWASTGRVLPGLLEALLEAPFFRQPPPRSTGREDFDLAWLRRRIRETGHTAARAEDVQATLAELTAAGIAMAISDHAPIRPAELIVCGGGAYNSDLLRRLERRLGCRVVDSRERGLEPRWVEACAFAWLARETLAGHPGNLPTVTGASRPLCLGGLYRGRPVVTGGNRAQVRQATSEYPPMEEDSTGC